MTRIIFALKNYIFKSKVETFGLNNELGDCNEVFLAFPAPYISAAVQRGLITFVHLSYTIADLRKSGTRPQRATAHSH